MADDLPKVPIEEQLESAKRELKIRGRVYPRRVEKGHMTQKQADYETRCMDAIVATLEGIAAAGRLF